MTKARGAVLACLFIAGASLLACGSARRSPPLGAPPLPATPAVVRGERVFMDACHSCHPGGESGLGPSLNDKPLPRFLIAMQVRRGLGAMPAFSPQEISDADLDAVIAYLAARRS
jgi:mono/diheme cytochrome c family protein